MRKNAKKRGWFGSFISFPTRSRGREVLEMAKERESKLSETTMEGRPVAARWDALSSEERAELLAVLSRRGMSAFALNWIQTLDERWERRAVFILAFQLLLVGICMVLYWFDVLVLLIPSASWLKFIFPLAACLVLVTTLRTMGRLESKNDADEEKRRLCRYDWLSLKIIEAALDCAGEMEQTSDKSEFQCCEKSGSLVK